MILVRFPIFNLKDFTKRLSESKINNEINQTNSVPWQIIVLRYSVRRIFWTKTLLSSL